MPNTTPGCRKISVAHEAATSANATNVFV